MKRQLELMNKEVNVLTIIDTFADHTDDFVLLFPKKVKRRLNKWLKTSISFIRNPRIAVSIVSSLSRRKIYDSLLRYFVRKFDERVGVVPVDPGLG